MFDPIQKANEEREAGTYVNWTKFGQFAPIIAATRPFAKLIRDEGFTAEQATEALRKALALCSPEMVADFRITASVMVVSASGPLPDWAEHDGENE
jgi:hypothetical protein